jgi:PHS family inorganic phosphate transporter-like MFS transporter
MSFETEHKTIQMEDAISHDQLALEALERRRIALEEVHTRLCLFTRNSILDM